MSYWDRTDRYMNHHGRGPTCPSCGKEMFPQDDHGRFICSCSLGRSFDVVTGEHTRSPKIPQVDVSGMSDKEKAKISPISRFNSAPTAAEAKVLSMLLRGPDVMDSPEYVKACKALEDERKR